MAEALSELELFYVLLFPHNKKLPSQSCHLPVGGFVRKWAWTDGPGHGLPLGLNRRGTDGATHRLPKGRLTVEAGIIFSTMGMRWSPSKMFGGFLGLLYSTIEKHCE